MVLADGAAHGDRSALARMLSLVERGGDDAHAALIALGPVVPEAHVVGITGAPGAGKSTLTAALVRALRASGARVGVLAVDPSSPFTGGAILGDRIRMLEHEGDPDVYVRSMASRSHFGGLARATPQAVRVLDRAGFDPVLVETVGVGQSEVAVAATADTTVVVVNPGWGDAVQAAKAGLLEVGDVFVVNKADRPGAPEPCATWKRCWGRLVPASGGPPCSRPSRPRPQASTGSRLRWRTTGRISWRPER